MLQTVSKAAATLKRKGQDISVADIQAILWYYEKRLYGELGTRQTADISYEEAAKEIVSDRIKRSTPQDQLEQSVPVGEEVFNSESAEEAKVTRGYYDPANSVIRLTESSDLSTFLHEFAHFMYEMEVSGNTDMLQSIDNWYKRNADSVAKEAQFTSEEADLLFQPTTPPTPVSGPITAADVVTFLDNKTTGDPVKDAAIRRAVHEQFARGFETYLMEGKAPSIELRNAVRSFARWLTQI